MSIRYGTQFNNNGTVSTPSIRFINSENTGLYLSSTNNLDVTTNGVNRLNVSTTSITSTVPHLNPNGSVSAPSYSFTGRINTGIYSSTSDNVDITTSGVQRMTISNAAVTMTSRPYQTLNNYASTSGYLALAPQTSRTVSSADAVRAVSTWTTRTTPSNDWWGVCWSPQLTLFAAVSNSGSNNRVMTSPDGITWTSRTTPPSNLNYSDVCWAPERAIFCAVSLSGANDRVMTSTDGITWTSRTTPTSNNFHDICWAAEPTLDGNVGTFVAVAFSGTNNRVMTSPDGINWTSRSTPVDNDWRGVCWAPELGLFCAVSDSGIGNRVMTSPDGITWTSRTIPADNNWISVCWVPELGLFCAVAYTGTGRVMTSPDGITWTSRTIPQSNNWYGVCWAPELGLFCAVSNSGSNNRVMTSPNGITWTTRTTPSNDYRSVCWAPELGLFCAVATSGSGDRVMTSSQRFVRNMIVNSQLFVPSGSASNPTYTFTENANTGLYIPASNNLSVTVAGTEQWRANTVVTFLNSSVIATNQSVLRLVGNTASTTIDSVTEYILAGQNGTSPNRRLGFNSVNTQGTEIAWTSSTGNITITPTVPGMFLFNIQVIYSSMNTSANHYEVFLEDANTGQRYSQLLNSAVFSIPRVNMSSVLYVPNTTIFRIKVYHDTGLNGTVLINPSAAIPNTCTVLRLS